MTMAIRKTFRCVIVDPANNAQLCTGIQVVVPSGLTRNQAINYVAGVIAADVSRYAASEAMGFGPFDQNTDWNAVVT